MKITFVCRCGKRLRAREELARRRIMCPSCGSPVGVPSLDPTHRDGRKGFMTPEEISRRRGRVDPEAEAPAAEAAVGPIQVWVRRRHHNPDLEPERQWKPLDSPLVCKTDAAGKLRHRRRRQWELETHWQQCLLYPLRASKLVLGLAFLLTCLTFVAASLLPRLGEFQLRSAEGWLPALVLVLPLLILGYTANFLDAAVTTAVTGGAQEVAWAGANLAQVGRSLAKWLACFLAGPVLPAAGALWYWLACGDPDAVDYALLGELVVAALAWWLLTLLSVSEAGLAGFNPVRVGRLVHRMGWRALPSLAAPLAGLGLGWLALTAVEEQHREAAVGFLLLAALWLTLLSAGTFLLRLLGVWCHRTRRGQ
jgi:hypothetical protein